MEIKNKSILVDTGFFIRLLNQADDLHENIKKFFEKFLTDSCRLKCSSIAVGEYCVKGSFDQLPVDQLQMLNYSIIHAQTAGSFASTLFKKKKRLDLYDRNIIPNDVKLFAQAHAEFDIKYFVTTDEKCTKLFNHIKEDHNLDFELINARVDFSVFYNVLF